MANVLLLPINELIDLHSARVAAAVRHMPAMVVLLLLACSLVSVAVVGTAAAWRENGTWY